MHRLTGRAWRRWARSIRTEAAGPSASSWSAMLRDELGPGMAAVAAVPACRCRADDRASASPAAGRRPRGANWRQPGVGSPRLFVFDWCANGQQLKRLTVTDEWTKEGLAIAEVDGRLRSGRVIEVLYRGWSASVVRRATLALDNGPEFVARALLEWIVDQGIETALIDPQALAERRRQRELQRQVPRRVLEHGMVPLRAQAKAIIEAWRRTTTTRFVRIRGLGALFDAGRVRRESPTDQRSSRFRNGPDATRHGGFAPRPVATPSLKGQSSEQEMPVLST